MPNTMNPYSSPKLLMFTIIILLVVGTPMCHAAPGSWELLQRSTGVSAMHMQLLNNDRVIIFDRTNFGESNISLPDGKCRVNRDLMLQRDCTAHSIEYNVLTNSIRPLMILTDTWCSSGAVTPIGRLVQTGGWRDGERGVRLIQPCPTCEWNELGNKLIRPRWYASNHILPNGQIIIIGGLGQFNFEFYPKTYTTPDVYDLPFLQQTNDGGGYYNNLYPFVFLNVDGNLFIFSNNRAILYDYNNKKMVRFYPTIPDGHPRCYPSTGSAVLLPLKGIDAATIEAEVLVCGGAPKGSYQQANRGNFVPALNNCARMKITDLNATWAMETMPMPRTMGDMVLLPDGRVMIINGVEQGVAGWDLGRKATQSPIIYNPDSSPGSRFEVQAPSSIPRVYHSSVSLLRDGRVLVGGSNTHFGYEFGSNVRFPTDLSLEAFSPSYLGESASTLKPKIISPESLYLKFNYNQVLSLRFLVEGVVNVDEVKVTMILPPFCTHSFSQGQRLLVLPQVEKAVSVSNSSTYQLSVRMPNSAVLAPPVYYMLFLVHEGVPSEGKWLKMGTATN